MFAVLEAEEYRKGLEKWLSRFFEKDEVIMNYRTVKGAVPFITIKMQMKKKGIDWDEVRNAAGVCAKRLLLSKDIAIPDGYGVVRFKPSVYQSIPIFNSMIKTLRYVRKDRGDLNVTVLDKSGVLSERIDCLPDHARHVTVLTDNVTGYNNALQRVMDSCGAAIALKAYDHPTVNDSVVFADKYDDRVKNSPVVFCAEKEREYENAVTGAELEAEGFVLDNKPESIETFDFVAALYELNNLSCAGRYSFKKLMLAGEKISETQVIEMIENTL